MMNNNDGGDVDDGRDGDVHLLALFLLNGLALLSLEDVAIRNNLFHLFSGVW